MAVVKYGLIITDIKGKVGGQVLQGSNNSKILRNTHQKRNSTSSLLNQSTALLVQVTSQWRNISDANKLLWATGALLWPFTDKFGNTYYASAYQFYTAYNRNRLTINYPVVANPNIVIPAENIAPFTILNCTAVSIRIESTIAPAVAQFWLIYASSGLSTGRNDNNANLKLIKAINMQGLTTLEIITFYTAIFGVPVVGSKIVFQIIQCNPLYPFYYYPTTLSSAVV